VRYFEDKDIYITEARKVRPNLEDVFVEITGIASEQMRKDKQKGQK
jgi:ABC-2 type transport system ATP-binding protein